MQKRTLGKNGLETSALGSAFQAIARAAILESEFCGDHHLVAHGFQRFSDNFFVGERAISLCGIEKGNALVKRMPDEFDGILSGDGCCVAEIQPHAAESERGCFETIFPKCTFLHRSSSFVLLITCFPLDRSQCVAQNSNDGVARVQLGNTEPPGVSEDVFNDSR